MYKLPERKHFFFARCSPKLVGAAAEYKKPEMKNKHLADTFNLITFSTTTKSCKILNDKITTGNVKYKTEIDKLPFADLLTN